MYYLFDKLETGIYDHQPLIRKIWLLPLVTWRMHALSGGGSLILLVWSGVFCLLRWLIRWPGLPWMLTKWLNFTSQPSLLRWAHPSQWWLLASTKTDILGLMLNACLKDASLLRSDGEMRPVRISGQWRKLDIAGCYTGFLHTKRRHYYTKRRTEVQHPARRWKLVGEATGLGGVTGRSAAPTAVTYSAYLNEKLDDICESTDGAPSPKFMSSNSISEFVQFCPAGFDEVQGLISSLPSKQRGLHSISTWRLKRRSHLLLPYLHLFNKSLSLSQFSRSFKEAQVRPILKKIYTWPTTTFIIQTNFQSQRAFKAYGAPCSQPSPHPSQQ